jgi:hypothetical protein
MAGSARRLTGALRAADENVRTGMDSPFPWEGTAPDDGDLKQFDARLLPLRTNYGRAYARSSSSNKASALICEWRGCEAEGDVLTGRFIARSRLVCPRFAFSSRKWTSSTSAALQSKSRFGLPSQMTKSFLTFSRSFRSIQTALLARSSRPLGKRSPGKRASGRIYSHRRRDRPHQCPW